MLLYLYQLLSSGLVSSRRLSSPFLASPLTSEHRISPQPTFCLIDTTSTASNQKQQKHYCNLIYHCFCFCIYIYIYISIYHLLYARLFDLVTSSFISSPLTSTSLILSHLFSFLLSQRCHLSRPVLNHCLASYLVPPHVVSFLSRIFSICTLNADQVSSHLFSFRTVSSFPHF